MSPFIKSLVSSGVRHVLTLLAGYLVAKGLATPDATASLTNMQDLVTGVVMGGGALAWSYVDKRFFHKDDPK